MVTWKEIVQHYHVKYYDRVAKVTQPLLECFDIVCVDYLKTFMNGRFTYLTNRPECTEYYASEQIYRNDPYFRHPDHYKTGFWWLENSGSCDFQECVSKVNHKFNMHSPLVLIEKGLDFAEMFCFSGRSDEAMHTLHLKHSQLLKTYTAYFKNELNSLIYQMGRERFSLIDLQGETFYTDFEDSSIKTEAIHVFLIALGKKAEVERASSLSPRERECLRLLIHGNSAKDSALELNLSHRTIEFYIEHVKNKLNCSSKRELFSVGTEFQNLGLL